MNSLSNKELEKKYNVQGQGNDGRGVAGGVNSGSKGTKSENYDEQNEMQGGRSYGSTGQSFGSSQTETKESQVGQAGTSDFGNDSTEEGGRA